MTDLEISEAEESFERQEKRILRLLSKNPSLSEHLPELQQELKKKHNHSKSKILKEQEHLSQLLQAQLKKEKENFLQLDKNGLKLLEDYQNSEQEALQMKCKMSVDYLFKKLMVTWIPSSGAFSIEDVKAVDSSFTDNIIEELKNAKAAAAEEVKEKEDVIRSKAQLFECSLTLLLGS